MICVVMNKCLHCVMTVCYKGDGLRKGEVAYFMRRL